ncbi:hypothetical protein TCAL_03106 [Tigriopus californicus]|uniref:Ras-GEF domain-containing protein n=1 Tax=Tigriopus californicus TaxID=6832 RepID=A0A553NNQ1_TIGCA|nr:hypothetical protein TCAL_03106 [Tigriopus californicus]
MYRRENQRQYELRADTISECQAWIDGIKMASFNKLHLQMEEVEQKHLHLLQVVESEKTAKWQYTQHCDELTDEIKKLRNELFVMKKEWRLLPQISKSSSSQDGDKSDDEEDPDIAKIKKVQSFFRGWLCRRRWKQIVEEYIRSPHAESMRKRNCLVFRMVESEEEYVEQLEILISCFLRPFKMAASSKNPPCTHEDINSIFLNSETVLFLHQIFLKGLTARMESWPTLVLGDLFDMLLPMLSIYQEYVRNHHYCLQVLTECKQNQQFGSLLHRLEKKPACKGRSLETFLTYPMHQIPRYIITLHELLAHTPPDHVEKKSLEHARIQLEDLSRQMHDEVSETENIRKNLAIERMIIEGCDILLDVNQMFVRQGTLVQILPPGSKSGARGRMGIGREKEREAVRQCFLFSNHLIITTRTQAGRLHLVDSVGKIPLADVTLVEDPSEEERMDEPESPCGSSDSSSTSDMGNIVKYEHKSLDFKLIMDDVKSGNQVTIHLVAPTHQEKASWITDITQCMDTVHFNGLFYNTMPNASSSTIPQCVKSDPNLFKDDVDIRFSKTFNTCKIVPLQIPQIRYATPERLLQRLTDLRFLNIDFLNTFLLTYRVFTDGITVLEALKMVFFNPDQPSSPTSSNGSMENLTHAEGSIQVNLLHPSQTLTLDGSRRISTCSGYSTATDNGRHGSLTPSRRISGASSLSGYYSDERERSSSEANHKSQHWKYTYRRYEEEQRNEEATAALPGSRHVVTRGSIALPPQSRKGSHDSTGSGRSGSIISTSQWRKESVTIVEQVEPITEQDDDATDRIEYGDTGRQNSLGMAPMPAAAGKAFSLGNDKDGEFLSVPKKTITASSSAETLTDNTLTAPSSPNQASNKRKGSVGANLMVRSSPSVDESELGGLDEVEDKKLLLAKTESSHELPLKSALKKCSISSIGSTHSPKSRARSTSTFSSASYTYNMNNEDDGSDVITARGCSSQPGSHHPSFSSPTGSRIVFGGLNLKDLTIGMKSPTKDTKKRKGIFNRHVGSSGNDTSNDHSSSPISSPQHSKMGVVVTSSRQAHRSDHNDSHSSKRASKDAVSLEYFLSELSDEDSNSWSSSANAAVAFAVATAGSGNPPDPTHKDAFKEAAKRKMSLTSSVSTMRVLSVLRHWVTKHTQDFESNVQLKNLTIEFLEDIICTPTLLPSEHRASSQLLRMLTKDEPSTSKFNLDEILTPTQVSYLLDSVLVLAHAMANNQPPMEAQPNLCEHQIKDKGSAPTGLPRWLESMTRTRRGSIGFSDSQFGGMSPPANALEDSTPSQGGGFLHLPKFGFSMRRGSKNLDPTSDSSEVAVGGPAPGPSGPVGPPAPIASVPQVMLSGPQESGTSIQDDLFLSVYPGRRRNSSFPPQDEEEEEGHDLSKFLVLDQRNDGGDNDSPQVLTIDMNAIHREDQKILENANIVERVAQAIPMDNFKVATQESLSVIQHLTQEETKSNEDIFSMEDHQPASGQDKNHPESHHSSQSSRRSEERDKPKGKLAQYIMKSAVGQSWFFKNPDEADDESSSPSKGKRSTGDAPDKPSPVVKANKLSLREMNFVPSRENINTLSALEIAEQMTFLDQKILFTIQSSEFLGQAWTKPDKDVKSPHIVIMTKRFNDMSCLVISDIVTEPDVATRVQVIEKWTAVADICRCLHNFNGVLQICAAFTNSSVFRLKNTWNRVSKSTKQTIEKLQALVSSDGRFRNLRDSLHRTDPPCIPYLGMYLSDLTFIEEGTPNFTDNRLLNFAKMRMIAHVIREIRQFQQTPYKIDQVPKVTNYILDPERQLDDEMLYQQSLIVEPRTSRLSSSFGHSVAAAAIAAAAAKEQQ